MTKETVSLAILFAEICQADAFYKTLGNQEAQKLVKQHFDLISKQAARYKGTVIKTSGGSKIMCTFPDIMMAVDAACAMQQAVDQMPSLKVPDLAPSSISIGIHFGSAIWEDNDLYGDAVNVAARMLSLAKPRHIITIEETIRALPAFYQSMTRLFDKTTIKGKSGEHNLYEIVWEQQEITDAPAPPLSDFMENLRLTVQYHETIVDVSRDRPSITLGRHDTNDIVINDFVVSRIHAAIEYNRGKFVLIDQSSNGTYLYIHTKNGVLLRREQATLFGSGYIGLGRDVEPDSSFAIQFFFPELGEKE